jgi:enamine deaminase RidA (YjgF/YER057c/UK114 family)
MSGALSKRVIVPPEFSHYSDDWHFSPLVQADGFVFVSGVTSCRLDNTVSPDPETQFRDAFQLASRHLTAAGLSFVDVVEMTTYHVDLRRHLAAFTQVKDQFVAPPYPAWTAVGVTELITDGTLIEIRLIARHR